MNHTKTNLIQNSLKLLGNNPSHTFFAVTIRPYEDFLRRFPYSTRTQVTEDIIKNLITKYDAHLKAYPVVPGNQVRSCLAGLSRAWRIPLAVLRRRGFRRVGVAFLRGFCWPVMSQ